MKKLLLLLIALLFNISISQAGIYYYEDLNGLVNAPDSGKFCDVELGNCTYSDMDVNLSFDEESTYLELGVEATLSYSISGTDVDSTTLSIVSENEELIPSSDLVIDTVNKTITVPASAINQSGEVRIVLQAKDSDNNVVAQDYTYLNIETINSKNMLTLWTVDAGETVQFPFSGEFTNKYDGHVDWGDDSGIETFEDTKIQDLTHTYTEAGTYEIRIDGSFYDEDSFAYMFKGITIPSGFDISQWDVSNVNDLAWTFREASIPTGFDISSWDMSNLMNFWGTFYAVNFPSDFNINSWNTPKLQRMYSAFNGANLPASFDISSWNVSNVNEMRTLFYNSTLQGDLNLSSWDFSNLASIESMFNSIILSENIIYNEIVSNSIYSSFLQLLANPSIGLPDSSTAQKIVAGANACAEDDNECLIARKAIMAKGWVVEDATVNANLTIDEDTVLESRWTVSAGEAVSFPMYYTYSGIIDWGDGVVEEFDDLKNTTHTYAESGTYTTRMNGSWGNKLVNMFSGQTIPSNLDISLWDMSKISSVNKMFSYATIPSGFDISSWDMSNVGSMHLMFYGAIIPSGFDIKSWNMSGLSDNSYLWGMFYNATIPSGFDISDWDISNITVLAYMFNGVVIPSGFDISNWDTKNVDYTEYMFYNATIPDKFSFNGWDLSKNNAANKTFSNANILGDLIYDETVSSPIYSAFMKILADDAVGFPDSTISQKTLCWR